MNTTTTPSAKDKLDQARARVQTVMRAVTVNEGRLLDFETADSINRTLFPFHIRQSVVRK